VDFSRSQKPGFWLCELSEAFLILDDNTTVVEKDEASSLHVTEGQCHRFSRGTDIVRDFLVRKFDANQSSAGLGNAMSLSGSYQEICDSGFHRARQKRLNTALGFEPSLGHHAKQSDAELRKLLQEVGHQARWNTQDFQLVDGNRTIPVRTTDRQWRLTYDIAHTAIRDGELAVTIGPAHDERSTSADEVDEVTGLCLGMDWAAARNLNHGTLAHDFVDGVGIERT